MTIHPTAIIEDGAKIALAFQLGPIALLASMLNLVTMCKLTLMLW